MSDIEKSLFNRAFHLAAAKRGGFLPPFECIKHNGSLLFGHSHFSTGHTFRSPLNYIQIAGYHIEVKRQPLSKVNIVRLHRTLNLLYSKVYTAHILKHHNRNNKWQGKVVKL